MKNPKNSFLTAIVFAISLNSPLFGDDIPKEIAKEKKAWQSRLSPDVVSDEDAKKVHYLLAMILNLNAMQEDAEKRLGKIQIAPPEEESKEAIQKWIKSNEVQINDMIPAIEAYLAILQEERAKLAPSSEVQP